MVSRQLMEHWIWTDERFSRGQAWLDLLMMVNYQDSKLLVDGEVVTVPRGSVITSQIRLAQRWNWTRAKVGAFLKLLKSDGMIDYNCNNHFTCISITNYRSFQDYESAKNAHADTPVEPTGSREIGIEQATPDTTTDTTGDATTGAAGGAAPVATTVAQNNKDNKDNKNNKENKENKELDAIILVMHLYSELCVSMPRHPRMTASRSAAIRELLKIYSMEDLREAFRMADESDFLRGINDRGWKADFDWLMKPANLAKVLSGKYDNKKASVPTGASGQLGEAELEAIQRVLEGPVL